MAVAVDAPPTRISRGRVCDFIRELGFDPHETADMRFELDAVTVTVTVFLRDEQGQRFFAGYEAATATYRIPIKEAT